MPVTCVADAQRRRLAKESRVGVSHRSMVREARLWVGAAFVRLGEQLQGTVTVLPATDVSTSPEPQTAG
jgi:hypothetical protein